MTDTDKVVAAIMAQVAMAGKHTESQHRIAAALESIAIVEREKHEYHRDLGARLEVKFSEMAKAMGYSIPSEDKGSSVCAFCQMPLRNSPPFGCLTPDFHLK